MANFSASRLWLNIVVIPIEASIREKADSSEVDCAKSAHLVKSDELATKIEMTMNCKRGFALVAAWIGLLFAVAATTVCAQAEWVTTLNVVTSADTPALPTYGTTAARLPDGSTYIAARTSCCTRDLRIVLLNPGGTKVWERWIDDKYENDTQIPLVVQSDDSIVVLYDAYCMAHFSRSGDKLAQVCGNGPADSGDRRYATLPDGDIIIANGRRTVIRMAPTGQIRWQATDAIDTFPYSPIITFGINSDGNYYELTSKQFRVWRATDGDLIINAAASSPCCTDEGLRSFPSVALPNRSVVMVEASFAGKVTLAKYSNEGEVLWRLPGILPSYNAVSTGWLLTHVEDGSGDVLFGAGIDRGNSFGSSGTAARISANGLVMWQREIDGVSRFARIGTELLAFGTTVSSNVFTVQAFPVNVTNGAVGAKRTYSQPAQPPAPITESPRPPVLLSTADVLIVKSYWPSVTLKSLDSNFSEQWVHALTYPVSAGLGTKPCSAKPLVRSNTGDWWARLVPSLYSDAWVRTSDLNGAISVRGPLVSADCGFPITNDDGRVLISDRVANRIRKVDSSGATVWTTPGIFSFDGISGLPLIRVATNTDGDTVYAFRGITGRVSATGVLRFERTADLLNLNFWNVMLVQFDNAGNSIVYGEFFGAPSGAAIVRFAPDGTVLSSTHYPSMCASVRPILFSNNELLVAGCGAVQRIGVDGTILWKQSLIQPLSFGTYVSSLTVDSLGNVFVGGCFRSEYYDQIGFGGIVISSWDNAGVERWHRYARAAFNASQCVSALAADNAGGVFASVVAPSSGDVDGETFLTHFDTAGNESWRHAHALSARFAREADIALGADGFLRILAAEGGSEFGPGRVTLRKLNPALLAASARLRVLVAPSLPIPYRDTFSFGIGLMSNDGRPYVAQSPVEVRVGVQSGSGVLIQRPSCVITVGASSCVLEGVIYSGLEQGVTFWFSADGMATVVSPAVSFGKSPTSTTISFVGPPPYTAYTYRRVAFSLAGASATSASVDAGLFSGSFADAASELYDCRGYASPRALVCNFLVRSAPPPLQAAYAAATIAPSGGFYLDSAATPLSISVQKVTPTVYIEADPDNIFVQGEPLLLRVTMFVPNGVNVTKFIAAGTLRANGVDCPPPVIAGTVRDGFAGSYSRCSVVATSSGNFPVSVSFAGSDDLLPSDANAYSVAISPRAELHGTGSFAAGTQACSTSARTRCTVSDASNWQCVGPQGMTGLVFFQPLAATGGHYSASPVQFSNVTSVQSATGGVAYVASASSCSLDVDGDGARMSHTDGVLILRRMLGLTDVALTVGATHSCAPRSAASIASAINLAAYDIDGDGQTRAATDGLLLLRAMLGFRGNALISGVIGATATRKSAAEIQNFLSSNCSYALD